MPVGSNWAGDDHYYPATYRDEGRGTHFQATAQEAAERGWYYRRAWYLPLEPDTRRCRNCGNIFFDAFELTDAEKKIRSPMSTQVLLHEDGF